MRTSVKTTGLIALAALLAATADTGIAVTEPSGIDLADGTWASLGMTGNDVVDVTYLWKAA